MIRGVMQEESTTNDKRENLEKVISHIEKKIKQGPTDRSDDGTEGYAVGNIE